MSQKYVQSVREFSAQTSSFDFALRSLPPTHSYRDEVTSAQQRVLNCILASAGICALLQPAFFYIGLAVSFFFLFSALIFWRGFLISVGILRRLMPIDTNTDFIAENDLPIYSILIPVYDEPRLMRQLAKALEQIDWPQERLDILVLFESHDHETFQAARQSGFPVGTRFVRVPAGGPLTKPNALNHGLSCAEGDFVTVYDVEDLPAPDQLRRAHALFSKAPPDLVCLQARLHADNPTASWLAAHWALEYDLQFGLLLPGAALYQLPLLLGGTSNHFRREALVALGGWDAYNVTEDADLGMRIARAGLRTQTFVSSTLEDAPVRLSVWMPQRGRWIKGYLQTWLVLMRRPGQTCREMGGLNFLAMQLSLGGAILTPLSHALLIALMLIIAAAPDLAIGSTGWSLFASGYAVSLIGDLAAPGPWSWQRGLAVLTKPLYWPLLSIAAILAVWDLAKRPHFWAKTPHTPRNAEPAPNCSTGSSA